MKKILPLLLMLIGIGGGVGAGLVLRPDHAPEIGEHECAPQETMSHDTVMSADHSDETVESQSHEYVKLNNQFVIPLVNRDVVESLIVMSLSVEIKAGSGDIIYQHEPKLRDQFLEVLFQHANMGGFRGEFTDTNNLDVLKHALLESAQAVIGTSVTSILITDLARQDG